MKLCTNFINKIYPAGNLNCHNRHKLRGKGALTLSRIQYECQSGNILYLLTNYAIYNSTLYNYQL